MTPEEKGREIAAKPALRPLLVNDLSRVQNSHAPLPQRYIRLREITDAVSKEIVPFTPCRKGCSHCCHMAVMTSEHEAHIIGRHIQRKPVRIKWSVPNTDEVQRRYKAVACTFLGAEGECTIYEVRPIACRTYFSLEETAAPCEIKNAGTDKVSRLRLDHVLTTWLEIHGPRHVVADIRDFFPPESRKPPG